ncbi:hypothetical protein BOSE62_40185 [Bosea sp. 62]|nr:hypothetical protein BOSE46_120603 [Bosea sp. 46]CAD5263638.1 hypothetical protein BOSE21B_110834 [Bosea sp. 21B]CAD5276640.1 hypothetical protein BOSE7B_40383 [Bosea sp. 7B]VVT59017.1 hypothetical protein BOS5A_200884 [Bosea sp. EC-HK365B]VXB65707.1 hypothetical protein BOSE29B_110768 [Bosea sp. 29B]VXC06113.1 hypothetical protein BOSE125_160559 [Bosea sp. 125]VXC35314.1 hypothetical protein BOSE62_40185 [Bosea sp. 62]VXC77949.1 hypothetical protein BOSE127_50090 [Bosea sp. 127]
MDLPAVSREAGRDGHGVKRARLVMARAFNVVSSSLRRLVQLRQALDDRVEGLESEALHQPKFDSHKTYYGT